MVAPDGLGSLLLPFVDGHHLRLPSHIYVRRTCCTRVEAHGHVCPHCIGRGRMQCSSSTMRFSCMARLVRTKGFAFCSGIFCSKLRISNSQLHRILRLRMGAYHLPVHVGRHLRLPRARLVCQMCGPGPMCDEWHFLMECSAVVDLRVALALLIADSAGIMAKLVWADDQPLVSTYIIACLDRA